VGGWTYSQSGHFGFVTDAGKRATFVSSVVQLIKDYGFDGMYAHHCYKPTRLTNLLPTAISTLSSLQTKPRVKASPT
jgi:hypothetical protein